MANESVPRGATISASETIAKAAAAADAQMAELIAAHQNSPEMKLQRDRDELARLQSDPYTLDRSQREIEVLQGRIAAAEAGADAAVAAQVLSDEQRVNLALEGKVSPWASSSTINGQIPLGDLGVAIEDLRAAGLNAVQIDQAVNGAKYHRVTIDAARALYETRMADAEWVAKLAAGDRAVKREHTLIGIVLNATCVADDA
jgi:hypothetical protein